MGARLSMYFCSTKGTTIKSRVLLLLVRKITSSSKIPSIIAIIISSYLVDLK